jgi:hypothetical protein
VVDGGAGQRPPYWWIQRISTFVDANWIPFDGWCAARSVNPLTLSFPRLLNLAFWCWREWTPDNEKWADVIEYLDEIPNRVDAAGLPVWARGDEEMAMSPAEIAAMTGARPHA